MEAMSPCKHCGDTGRRGYALPSGQYRIENCPFCNKGWELEEKKYERLSLEKPKVRCQAA